ncbi:GTPase HflX [Aurantimonas sp. MSK8Z-1]|uniref:GTPase HflX n=1 Tax=Mangrovibrevibacter kandeliae TaxID=2968473 RepID=UPI00211890B3|nr:GTPase HflX [Aurantimonas sp. MSK8Z-1]MCW4114577.1 GTPase HflX [Aurantimonas sp. MSK8Z-1]
MAELDRAGPRGPIEHRQVATRAGVFVPVLKQAQTRDETGAEPTPRSEEQRLAEALGLAAAIELDIRAQGIVPVGKPQRATLIGSGKLEEIKGVVAAEEIGLVIIDHPLTPVQQRNLEKELNAKVLDRTGLILEIFGRRARTKEGRLQVDLAHLRYQRGRLVRSWTHLERQRGGAGFLGGPGETQIEADRRQLQEKISRLERELEAVRRTRHLHRSKRKKAPNPVVALVGYTNAGKSTLFNAITGAGVFAQNLLFATLDPTLRRVDLPHGTEVILSDTVGFISDLPTHLVAAFRATLEEVVEAELILHVRDMSDPDALAQSADVNKILTDLEIDTEDSARVVEVWNKVDRLDDTARAHLEAAAEGRADGQGVHLVSAISGEGISGLLADIEARIAGRPTELHLQLQPDSLGMLPWIYENGAVTERKDREDGSVALAMQLTAQAQAELRRMAEREAGLVLVEQEGDNPTGEAASGVAAKA